MNVNSASVSLLFYPSQLPRQYNGLGAVGDIELGENIGNMSFDGVQR